MSGFLGRVQYYLSSFLTVSRYIGNNIGSYPILVFLISLCVVIYAVRLVKYYS